MDINHQPYSPTDTAVSSPSRKSTSDSSPQSISTNPPHSVKLRSSTFYQCRPMLIVPSTILPPPHPKNRSVTSTTFKPFNSTHWATLRNSPVLSPQ